MEKDYERSRYGVTASGVMDVYLSFFSARATEYKHGQGWLDPQRLGGSLMASISEQLLELEKKLLDPVLRRSPQKLAPMLAEDFVEFGSSGRAYDKKQVLYALRKQLPGRLIIEEFRVREISSTAALVTYRARAESADHKTEKYSLRSSLWVRRGDDWQMGFHQGTLVSENRGF